MSVALTILAIALPVGIEPTETVAVNSDRITRRERRRYRREHRKAVRVRRVVAGKWRVVAPYNGWLERTAQCESGGNWFIATGNGFFGGLQFTLKSWAAVGGIGYPHQNSILEQKYRGVKLLHLQGPGAWPVCGA